MAHKKGMGSTRNGRDSEAKRLGVKKFILNPFLFFVFVIKQVKIKFATKKTRMSKSKTSSFTIFFIIQRIQKLVFYHVCEIQI